MSWGKILFNYLVLIHLFSWLNVYSKTQDFVRMPWSTVWNFVGLTFILAVGCRLLLPVFAKLREFNEQNNFN